MTIAELIEILQTHDQEATIYLYSSKSFVEDVRGVAQIYKSTKGVWELNEAICIY